MEKPDSEKKEGWRAKLSLAHRMTRMLCEAVVMVIAYGIAAQELFSMPLDESAKMIFAGWLCSSLLLFEVYELARIEESKKPRHD